MITDGPRNAEQKLCELSSLKGTRVGQILTEFQHA